MWESALRVDVMPYQYCEDLESRTASSTIIHYGCPDNAWVFFIREDPDQHPAEPDPHEIKQDIIEIKHALR